MVETTTALVVKVGPTGATIAYNGQNQLVGWDALRAAARQDDPELRRIYAQLLKDAEEKAAHGPVTVSVGQDNTNVYWVVRVRAEWGGGWGFFRRLADEGGTHYTHGEAWFEAEGIAKRLGERATLVRR